MTSSPNETRPAQAQQDEALLRKRRLAEARWHRLERPRFQPRGDPTRAMHILKTTFRKLGIDHELDKYRFVLYWEQIVGQEIAKRSRVECLRGRTLIVRVASGCWAQELSFLKEQILERLHHYVQGTNQVDDIRFEIG